MSYRPEWLAEGAGALVDRVTQLQRQKPGPADVDCEVAIIGSGYGGAVAAARFARALRGGGDGVWVLERGAEYIPGSFPSGIADVPWHVRMSRPDDAEVKGRADGLYDFRIGKDVNALVGNGLGGGSLINAGVAERPEPDVFGDKQWPSALRRDVDELEAMYRAAETMLGAAEARTQNLDKYFELSRFAFATGRKARPVKIAVRNEDGRNGQGVEQKACVRCGDCVSGCNFWAKNTLPMNYLAEAKALGAQLYTGATVSHVVWDKQHWNVYWRRTGAQHPTDRDPKDPARDRTHCVRARHVVISAGTFGSTEILLRSRAHGLHVSGKLGKRFSTNGDMIGVLYGQSGVVNAAPPEHQKFDERNVGPTITGMFSTRGPRERRVVVEELAIPGALRRLFEEIVTTGALPVQLARTDWSSHRATDDDPAAVHDERIRRTQVFAAMGDDGAGGALELVEGWTRQGPDGAIRVDWKDAGKAPIYEVQDELLAKSEGLGGMYLRNPLWKPVPEPLAGMLSGRKTEGKLFTVHPLGGCPMGENWEEGVVDDIGRVYDPSDPAERARVHPGLLVLDGSIVPVALGINPLLTITALAERAVRRYIRLQGWSLRADEKVPLPPLPPPMDRPRQPQQPDTAVRFAERMTGPLALDTSGEQYEAALEVTFSDISRISRFLRQGPHRVRIGQGVLDLSLTTERARGAKRKQAGAGMPEDEPERVSASVKGVVQWMERAPSCAGGRTVRALFAWLRSRALPDFFQRQRERGWLGALQGVSPLSLMALASNVGETRYLRYLLKLREDLKLPGGPTLPKGTRIEGLKTFRYAYGANPWLQLSRLSVTFTPPGGRARAAGILEIDLKHLIRRFTAMFQITRQRDQPTAILDVASIGLFMLRIVLKLHFWSFRAPEYEKFDPARAQRRMPGPLEGLACSRHWTERIDASRPDSTQAAEPLRLPLTRYWKEGAERFPVPVMLLHGFGSGGVQFAHEKLPHNLVRYLAERGHDVWVAELRTSIALPSSHNQWTLDDIAREDIPALADAVLRETGVQKLDVVAHCIGSAMFCTAVLGDDRGRIYPKVRSATLLQVGPLITLSPGNRFRGYMAAAMRRFMLTDHVDSSVDDRATALDTLIDRLLATYPYPEEEQRHHGLWPPCRPHTHIANCNRSAAVFSRLLQHDRVDGKTLDLLGDMIGHTNLTTFEQTAQYAFAERLTDRDASNLYVTDENVLERFRFPVRFLHGEKNDVFACQTARRSHKLLQDLFDQKHTSSVEILPGYGHLDPLIGFRAHLDVFPKITEFLRGDAGKGDAVPPAKPPRYDYPRRPLIGPVLGWTRCKDGKCIARIWCRTDDERSYAYFLIAVVLNGARQPVPGYSFKQKLLDSKGGDNLGEIDLLGVIDVPLPEEDDDYEIVLVGAHRSAASNMPPESLEFVARWSDPKLAAQSGGQGQPQAKPAQATKLPDEYGAAVLELRAGWQRSGAAAERARQADQFGYFERPDAVLLSKALLARLRGRQDAIDFALASCRYSASLVDRERADALFGVLRDQIGPRERAGRPLALLLLVGDQIYSDATAGLFDPKTRRGRFDDSYRESWTAPNARAVLRRLPTYMMMDDHEIADDWHPGDRLPEKLPESRNWGLVAFEDYQLSHSPRGQRAPASKYGNRQAAGPYHYEFESGGFHFFVCDTRSEREGRERIMSRGQMAALARWMDEHKSDDGRPLFVVSPSVVLPLSRSKDADDWSGFSESLRALFSCIATGGVRNVVFLCGDSHLAMATRIDISGGKLGASHCLCVVGSPLYAPMPFANTRPADADGRGTIALDNGARLDYVRDPESIVSGDSVSILGARRESGKWQVTVDVHQQAGTIRRVYELD